MLKRLGLWLLILVVMAFVGWCVYPLFLPTARKVSLRQEKLMKTAEKRDWDAVKEMMTDNYRDGFGMDREEALKSAQEVFTPFLSFGFDWKDEKVEVEGDTATVTGMGRMHGTGATGVSEILNRVNQIQKPWSFVWKRHPITGDWKLSSVSNPELGGVAP
jgi:hypothetical protein